MTITEFEELTGIYPDKILYDAIEEAYNNSDYGDMESFCHDYKFNVDGLAKNIRETAERERWKAEERQRNVMKNNTKYIQELIEKVNDANSWAALMSRKKIFEYALSGAKRDLIRYCTVLSNCEEYQIEAETVESLIRVARHIKELQKELDIKRGADDVPSV